MVCTSVNPGIRFARVVEQRLHAASVAREREMRYKALSERHATQIEARRVAVMILYRFLLEGSHAQLNQHVFMAVGRLLEEMVAIADAPAMAMPEDTPEGRARLLASVCAQVPA